MRFRIATIEDLEWISENSINDKVDRKLEATVDYAYTLEDKGEVLAVGGFRMITPTTCWCWIDMAPKSHDNLLSVYRATRDWIDGFAKKMGIRRLQAFVRPDFPEAIRLVEHLGFQKESLMKNFFGDDDGLMYIRILGCLT